MCFVFRCCGVWQAGRDFVIRLVRIRRLIFRVLVLPDPDPTDLPLPENKNGASGGLRHSKFALYIQNSKLEG